MPEERLGPLSLKPGALESGRCGLGGSEVIELVQGHIASGSNPDSFDCRLRWAGLVSGPDWQIARLRDMAKAVGTESTQSHGPLGLLWARTDTGSERFVRQVPSGHCCPPSPP